MAWNKAVSDKRLRRDINIIKQALEEEEITGVDWAPTTEMLADALTKKQVNNVKLLETMQRD